MGSYFKYGMGCAAAGALLAISAGIAQADGPGVARGKAPHGHSVVRKHPPQAVSPAVPPLLNPMGHNLAETIIRPAIDPVPFQPSFGAPPPPIHAPGHATFGPQVPAISPSAPILFSPPVQTIDPLTGQVIIIQR